MFNRFPYTDFHELNLDWIIHEIHKLHADWDEFSAVNEITNAGAWDITRQYAAWTVVSDNNAGYISFKPVPAGITLDNTEYWGLIADYDILITDLSDRITALESEIQKMNLRSFIVIADSYGEVVDADGKNFAKAAFDLMGIPASRYQIRAKGGTGFEATYDGKNFITLLSECDTTNANDVTDIFVWGGANDISEDPADIKAKMRNFVTLAKTMFPKAKVQIGHPGTTWNGTGAGRLNRLNNSLAAYRNAGEVGASYIENSEYILDMSSLMAQNDTAHPNTNGVNEMTQQFIQAINTGSCNVHYVTTSMPTLEATTPGTYAVQALQLRFDNGVVRVITTAGGDFLSVVGGTPSDPLALPVSGALGAFVKFPVSFFATINEGTNSYSGIKCTAMLLDADTNKWATGTALLYPAQYNANTREVIYGINLFTGNDARSITHLARLALKLPDLAEVI